MEDNKMQQPLIAEKSFFKNFFKKDLYPTLLFSV
jgi:hypothetical protein